ncbi:MAG: hypothetical protein R2787_06070 [Saprospiraceae bacterium]
MRIIYLIIFLGFTGWQDLAAQTRILVQPGEVISSRSGRSSGANQRVIGKTDVISAYVTNFFSTHRKFQVVDRNSISYIQKERELQKSEEFMDGYMVEQGKIEGADYIFRITYIEDEKTLSFQIYDVATGLHVCGRDQVVRNGRFGSHELDVTVRNMLYEVLYDCFDLRFSFVRPLTEKNKSVQTALIAIGRSSQAKERDLVEFYQLVSEVVDGEEYVRRKVIAKGEITEVQDDHFSNVKISEGHVELYRQKEMQTKIYTIIHNELH